MLIIDSKGFTLIEMLVTIAISIILLSLAVPSFQSFIVQNRLSTQSNDLMTDLAIARSEAVKRGVRVSICGSNNGTSCVASSWGLGRIIFTDTGTAGTIDGADIVLRASESLSGAMSLAGTTDIADFIQYSPLGSVIRGGNFTLCKAGVKGRTITVAATGRVSSVVMMSDCA